jgi:GT2 family glycosyltransferase/glycosyltransferase involved in cell wall biosynthesis
MAFLKRFLKALPSIVLSPLILLVSMAALALADLAWKLFGRRDDTPSTPARRSGASVVIPNWNGKDLLEKYLPSVIEAMGGNEILVVDNGSEDGSAEFVRATFPQVTVLALPENLGFGGGSNAGFRAASNDIVVLLNSDMRVAPDFLAPLIEGFADPDVFAVSCQIFFSDPDKLREETGLTQAWWQDGGLRVRHRIDDHVRDLFPCFYGGGGSCAFDRRKFLELGGFDRLLAPFYLEDTDLGYMAWKRGWKVLYQPRSVVYHEHRGTIGKKFTYEYIQSVLNKNFLLFCQKNIHEWRRLGPHFLYTWMNAMLAVVFGDAPLRPNFAGMWRALCQLPGAMRSRWRARSLARVDDTEAFRRPLGGYFRDRFDAMEREPERLRVLFVSPYPICPPVHGGGVFMYQTLRRLAPLAETHVVELLDWEWQDRDNLELREFCASAEWLVRPPSDAPRRTSLLPHAVEEHAIADLEWAIHRQIYLKKIDVVQLEYTPLAQFRCEYRRIVQALFEHDVYFQSIGRALGHAFGPIEGIKARMEYLRALRYELRALPAFDQVQLCTPANRDYVLSFLPDLAARLRPGLRAGIDTSRYEFRASGREPYTMLFLGSFKHDPNRVAMEWFAGQVLPLILQRAPQAKLVVAGSDPPPAHAWPDFAGSLELLGFVDNVREPLGRYSVFVCPILSGSGVRVKLLEAYAAGIPVVSTRIGAEGLAGKDGEFCSVADDPAGFADRVVALFQDPHAAGEMAARARAEVEANWDMAAITCKLVEGYREMVKEKRSATSASSGSGPS